mmetsp:Transcript_20751/g.57453  ORF Transcript_20751/g.57453 Transcript_20751/m.57453 type:complete len:412 (+) Transcript_20751:336-1571(+)
MLPLRFSSVPQPTSQADEEPGQLQGRGRDVIMEEEDPQNDDKEVCQVVKDQVVRGRAQAQHHKTADVIPRERDQREQEHQADAGVREPGGPGAPKVALLRRRDDAGGHDEEDAVAEGQQRQRQRRALGQQPPLQQPVGDDHGDHEAREEHAGRGEVGVLDAVEHRAQDHGRQRHLVPKGHRDLDVLGHAGHLDEHGGHWAEVGEHRPLRQRTPVGHLVVDELKQREHRGHEHPHEQGPHHRTLNRRPLPLRGEGPDCSDERQGSPLDRGDRHGRVHDNREGLVDEVQADDQRAERDRQHDHVVHLLAAILPEGHPAHANGHVHEQVDGHDDVGRRNVKRNASRVRGGAHVSPGHPGGGGLEYGHGLHRRLGPRWRPRCQRRCHWLGQPTCKCCNLLPWGLRPRCLWCNSWA